MFNVKDVPVATGHTLATLGLLLHVRDAPARRPVRLGRAGCLVAGLVLTLGTRPGMWSGSRSCSRSRWSASSWRRPPGVRRPRHARRARRRLRRRGRRPSSRSTRTCSAQPLRALPRTSESSSSFLDGEKSDRLYVPRHLAEDLPTLLMVVRADRHARRGRRAAAAPADRPRVRRAARAGGRPGVHAAGRRRRARLRPLPRPAPAAVRDPGARRAGGVRHGVVVGATPADAAGCSSRWWPASRWCCRRSTRSRCSPTRRRTSTSRPTSSSAAAPDDMRPGGDYWRVSIPELVARHALDHQLLCKATTTKDTDLAYPFTNGGEAFSTSRSIDCREEANGPLAPDRMPVVRQLPATQYDAVFIGPLPRNCTPIDDVSRWRHGFAVVLTRLGRCTVDPAPLPLAGRPRRRPGPGDHASPATCGSTPSTAGSSGRATPSSPRPCPQPSSPSERTPPVPTGAPW